MVDEVLGSSPFHVEGGGNKLFLVAEFLTCKGQNCTEVLGASPIQVGGVVKVWAWLALEALIHSERYLPNIPPVEEN